jgi:hypothetical protein
MAGSCSIRRSNRWRCNRSNEVIQVSALGRSSTRDEGNDFLLAKPLAMRSLVLSTTALEGDARGHGCLKAHAPSDQRSVNGPGAPIWTAPCNEPEGPPGWMVLGRAYEKLLVLEKGWIAGRRVGDPIDD